MRFRDDTRGVTVQVGAVLLFATIIIALSVYQATVVPSENADVEYRHSQQVQGQLVDVRNALVATAETGNGRPATVSLGTEYPNRVFLVNPPPPAGTLETDAYANSNISVSNVVATRDETADYLNFTVSDPWTAETKSLSYVPGYHEYRDAPEVRYEASLLSNYYPEQNTSVPLTDQQVVNENTRTVSLVALTGSLGTSRSSSVAVDPEALSAPAERVQVRRAAGNQPMNVTIPTVLDAGVLRNSTSLGEAENVTVTDHPTVEDRVVVSVNWTGTFTLRTAKVGVGSGTSDPDPHYLTLVESDDDSVTVEARDAYNNPESGALVSANESSIFVDADGNKTTNEDGRATFEVDGDQEDNVQFELVDGTGDPAERTVNASVDTTDGEVGGGGNESGGPYEVQWNTTYIQSQSGVEYYSSNDTVVIDSQSPGAPNPAEFAANVTNKSGAEVDSVGVDFATTNATVVTFDPSEADTNEDGQASTETYHASGSATVYAEAGGSSDELGVRVTGSGDKMPPSVDSFSLSEGEGKSINADWSVSDSDGDLSSVEVQFDSQDSEDSGTRTTAVSGGSATGTSTYKGKNKKTYDVTIIVTDSAGNTDTETRTIAL